MMAKKILSLAHRGFSGYYPENTRVAFEAAVEKTNCDGFESDVHFSKDGKLVIIHDPVLDRTSNGTGYVKDYTYEELLQFDLGAWKGEEFAGQRMMTWADLLDFCKQTHKVCNLEIWAECFGREPANIRKQDSYEINAIMAKLEGWKRYDGNKSGKLSFKDYGSQVAYVRLEIVNSK